MVSAIKREPRYLPWYPEWTKYAGCTPQKTGMTFIELDTVFFHYGRNARRIRKAKEICATCPVIKKCYRQNREVPIGIFYGMTATERWRERGLKGYPNTSDAYSFFAQFSGRFKNGKERKVIRRSSMELWPELK